MRDMDGGYYDKQGNHITMQQWSVLHNPEYIRVAKTQVRDMEVSTVWLGIDHSFFADSAPIIFETMIFGGDRDQHCWRYSTEAEALDGHEYVVSQLQIHPPEQEPA